MQTGRPVVLFLFTRDLIWKVSIIVLMWMVYKIFYSRWFQRVLIAYTLPGPLALPFIGNAHKMTNNSVLFNFADHAYEKYGPLFRWWVGVVPFIFIVEPDDMKKVLGTTKNTDKNFVYSLMHNFLGDGLLTSSGDKWRFHRKLLQTNFHKSILEDHVSVFSKHSAYLVNSFSKALKSKANINITSYINDTVLDILHETVLGIKLEDRLMHKNLEKSPYREGSLTTVERLSKPWLLLESLYSFTKNSTDEVQQSFNLKSFTRDRIVEKRKNPTPDSEYKCLLEIMLEMGDNNPGFDEDAIISEACTFMLAGQDSVAAGIAFTLFYLAKHQDIQDKVYKEQEHIFGDSDRIATIQDNNQMAYLNQCIKETLRLCPSVPIISRKLDEEISIGKTVLSPGTDIIVCPYISHRLPHVYPDPLNFNPDRFSPEESAKRSPYAYLPFSVGPRNCIGYKFALLEMRAIISAILRKYRISLKEGYDLNLVFRITLRAKGGVWLNFHPREKAH